MTGQILPLHGSEHAAADPLLPWYVNGTLRGDELARIERHLEACELCRQEVAWLREVFAACAALTSIADPAPAPLIARALAKPSHVRPRKWRSRIAEGWRSTHPWVRGLMAAQLAAVAVLGTLLAVDIRSDPGYRTLGSQARPTSSGDVIAVMFDPEMTEREMKRVVDESGGRIVDGPTTTNAFVLEVPRGHAPRAVQRLRAERMVRFAEPLGAAAERR